MAPGETDPVRTAHEASHEMAGLKARVERRGSFACSFGEGCALTRPLRVALFSDAFHEANGVATVSREFAVFARRQELPFFSVHGGAQTQVTCQQSFTTLELKRGPAAFRLDHELYCDPLLSRYRNWV